MLPGFLYEKRTENIPLTKPLFPSKLSTVYGKSEEEEEYADTDLRESHPQAGRWLGNGQAEGSFGAEMMRKPEEIPECSHFRLALRYGK